MSQRPGGMEPACVSGGQPFIFIGTNLDVRIVVESKDLSLSGRVPIDWKLRVLAAIDTPLSLAADAAMLPITVPLQILKVACSRYHPDEPIIHKDGEDVPIGEE